jgi:hypothetical protein
MPIVQEGALCPACAYDQVDCDVEDRGVSLPSTLEKSDTQAAFYDRNASVTPSARLFIRWIRRELLSELL